MAEVALFVLLILPLPYAARRKIFAFISGSPIVAKIQYGMKITFIFILILFVDSINRVYRVQTEMSAAKRQQGAPIMANEWHEVQARRFYAQRNVYLCGSTLFLSLILAHTYSLILELLRAEEKLKQATAAKGGSKGGVDKASDPTELTRLRAELDDARADAARKDRDLQAMKSQATGLHREYDALSDKYNAAVGEDGSGKKKK